MISAIGTFSSFSRRAAFLKVSHCSGLMGGVLLNAVYISVCKRVTGEPSGLPSGILGPVIGATRNAESNSHSDGRQGRNLSRHFRARSRNADALGKDAAR